MIAVVNGKPLSFKKRCTLKIAPSILRFLVSMLGASCKTLELGREHIQPLIDQRVGWVYSTWHDNVITASWVMRNQHISVMLSESFDGELMARVLAGMGYGTFRGSSSKSSTRVLLQGIRLVQKHKTIAVIPDGPRGPRHVLQPGVLAIAQKSGCPLIPLHVHATAEWTFQKSWDEGRLFKPFSIVVWRYGPPFYVTPDLRGEAFIKRTADFHQAMTDNAMMVQAEAAALR